MVKMDFDERGNRVSSYGQLLVMSKRGRGRPKKLDMAELDKIALSKPANDFPLFQQKRGRGRPRKNPVEPENQVPSKIVTTLQSLQKRGRGRPRKNPIEPSKPASDFLIKKRRGRPRKNPVEPDIPVNLKENHISDVKEKLKLLETITNGYREIERIDNETRKNVEKLWYDAQFKVIGS